ncbi:MAG: hypothetical protein L0Y60_15320 [Beijerinckiaceae bacterium]|nr:hypothetical protein [Beijerinckiaceae bacterium]
MTDGDTISVQGPFKAELYGEKRLSLSIVADNVLALRQPAKTRKAQPAPSANDRKPQIDYNDAIPF